MTPKHKPYLLSFFVLLLAVGFASPIAAEVVVFVEPASEWSYLPCSRR